MKNGVKRTNYWTKKVQYNGRTAAQHFLNKQISDSLKKSAVLSAADCSCNCYGGCSGGDCSSCSYGNS